MCFYIFYIPSIPYGSVPTEAYKDPNPRGPFSLEIKETIKKYQGKALEHLNKLKEVVGVEYHFSVDFEVMHRQLPSTIFSKRMVEIVLDQYLGTLVSNIVEFVNKKPENKRSFILKTYNKNIIFNPFLVKTTIKPVEIKFSEGNIYINLEPNQFGFLTDRTGDNLEIYF